MRNARWLVVAGALLMILGPLDAMEGAVLILAGCGLAAVGARLSHRCGESALAWAFALVLFGVSALVLLTAVGGFGGNSGRSAWWGLLLLPYAIGWLTGLAGATVWLLDDRRRRPAPEPVPW